MIDQPAPTAPTTGMHRIKCHVTRPKTVSDVFPEHGFTSWCQSCRDVHTHTWESLPSGVLLGIQQAIGTILLARGDVQV